MNTTITERPTEVEFDPNAYPNITDAYRHEDGSITYIVHDDDSGAFSPRDYDGNVATLIQRNSRCIDIDDDDAGLREAYEHFYGPQREQLVRRYLAIYRPDIAYYTDYWSAGDSYGWGYVTRADWDEAMGEDYTGDVTPEQAFDQEVNLYGQWANGEVYGAHHVTAGDPIVKFWDHGAYIDGYETDEEDCWGFLGYEDHKDITAQFTDSPVTEVLA